MVASLWGMGGFAPGRWASGRATLSSVTDPYLTSTSGQGIKRNGVLFLSFFLLGFFVAGRSVIMEAWEWGAGGEFVF